MPAAHETSDADVLSLAEELKRLRVERERLDARTTVIYERMAAALTRELGRPNPSSAAPSQAIARRERGLGDRVLALLRERPDADTSWLVAQVYGSDTPRNRRALYATRSYLHRAGKLQRREHLVTK